MTTLDVHVIGASGRSGAALCRALAAAAIAYTPVVRDPARWHATGLAGAPQQADLTSPPSLRGALQGARIVVSCAHARHTAAILDAAPAGVDRFVLLGSTRKFTRWPDAHGEGVLAGEAAFQRSSRRGLMLHPTMIYGAQGEDNVQRLARLLRRLPVIPLPGGGRNLVRPIYQGDVTRCIIAALTAPLSRPESIVVAGADRVTYAEFVRAIAAAAGLPRPRIVSLPMPLLGLAAPLTRLVPGLPTIRRAELRRLTEDKSWEIGPMTRTLGIVPVGLAEGLARTLAA